MWEVFLRGMGSVLSLSPKDRKMKPIKFTPILSDQEAFRKNLEQVGQDMSKAISILKQQKDMGEHEKRKYEQSSKHIPR